jgi:hypothetical protein
MAAPSELKRASSSIAFSRRGTPAHEAGAFLRVTYRQSPELGDAVMRLVMIRSRFAQLKGWSLHCYHCYQIGLYFSVRDDLGLTRRYSKSSGEVVINSGI